MQSSNKCIVFVSHKLSLLRFLVAIVMHYPRPSGQHIFVISLAPAPWISLQSLPQELQLLLLIFCPLICKLKDSHLEGLLATDSLFPWIVLQLFKTFKFGVSLIRAF